MYVVVRSKCGGSEPPGEEQVMARALWLHNGGEVSCTEHAGSYLASAVQSDPTATEHTTPLGVWTAMTAEDAAEWAASFASTPLSCETCGAEGTVTADDGTVFVIPAPSLLAAYAVAMYGEGHGPLDDGTPEAHDSLVTIAAQAALDATSGHNDPYGVFGGGPDGVQP